MYSTVKQLIKHVALLIVIVIIIIIIINIITTTASSSKIAKHSNQSVGRMPFPVACHLTSYVIALYQCNCFCG